MKWSRHIALIMAFAVGIFAHQLSRIGGSTGISEAGREGSFSVEQLQVLDDDQRGLFERYSALVGLLASTDTPLKLGQLLDASPDRLTPLVSRLWAETDPASRFAYSTPNAEFFRIWGADDPSAALKAVNSIGLEISPTYWERITKEAYVGWLATDPETVLNNAPPYVKGDTFPTGSDGWGWIKQDLDAALSALVAAPYFGWPPQGLDSCAKLIAERDPAATLDKYRDVSWWVRHRLVESVVPLWAERDLVAALAWLSQNTYDCVGHEVDGQLRRDLIYELLRKPVIEGGKAVALSILDQFAGSQIPEFVEREIALGWAREDPDGALEWVVRRSNSGVMEAVLGAQNNEYVLGWIQRTQAKDLSDESLAHVMDPGRWDDWEAVAAQAVLLPGHRRGYVLGNIALRGRSLALPALRESLNLVPEGDGREILIMIMGNLYQLEEDQAPAEKWKASLGNRDRATAEIRLF